LTDDLEKQLVEKAQKADVKSFEALYEKYYSALIALAYSITDDINIAEDIAQETFAIACRDLPKLKNKEKFGYWLAGICRNLAKQILRNKRNYAAIYEGTLTRVKDCQSSDEVHRAVRKLKPAERELIFLRYYENLPYEHIASVLGISIQAVNGRLIRAKRKIKKYITKE